MAINIGPVITNAHAALNLSHMTIMSNIQQAKLGGHVSTSDENLSYVDGECATATVTKSVRPWRAVIFVLLSLVIGFVLLSYGMSASDKISNLPQPYNPQADLSKRVYYPAYLVNRYHRDICNSKTNNCITSYTFVLRLDDGKYVNVNMTKDSYFLHSPGNSVYLEKHITDPKEHLLIEQHNQKYKSVYASIFGIFLLACGFTRFAYLVFRGLFN